MKAIEFYKLGLHHKAFYEIEWIFSVFSVTLNQSPHIEDYPFRVQRKSDGVYFLDMDLKPVRLDDVNVSSPILSFSDVLTLKPGDIPNVIKPIELTAGEALINAVVISHAFGAKIPCKSGHIDLADLEKEIAQRLTSDVPPEEEAPDNIYVRELKEYSRAVLFLTPLNDIAVPSASPKNVTCDPEMVRVRDEEQKRLGPNPSPVEVAKAEKKLESIDRAWTDDYGKSYFTEAKEYNNARKKLYSWVGYEKDFLDPNKGKMIYKSLEEGLDLENFVPMVNVSREGSFNRGYLTQLGGAKVKDTIRATQNIRVVPGFCGTSMGVPVSFTGEDVDAIVKYNIGFYSIERGTYKLITAENAKQLIGKNVLVSSPGFCKMKHPDLCSVCVGVVNANNPKGMSVATTNISSVYMNVFMKKMHVSTIQYAEYQPKIAFL